MSEYVTTIVEYIPKPISREDGSSFTIHKFKDVNGTELVARADVANLVRGMLNQPLRVTVRSEQKGQWLNHYLDHAEPAQNGSQGLTGAVSQAQAAQAVASGQAEWHEVPHVVLSEKDKQIHRQVAAKVAAKLSTTSNEFWTNVTDLAFYFDTGQIPANPAEQGYPEEDVPF